MDTRTIINNRKKNERVYARNTFLVLCLDAMTDCACMTVREMFLFMLLICMLLLLAVRRIMMTGNCGLQTLAASIFGVVQRAAFYNTVLICVTCLFAQPCDVRQLTLRRFLYCDSILHVVIIIQVACLPNNGFHASVNCFIVKTIAAVLCIQSCTKSKCRA